MSFYRSTIGKKIVVAVTGLLLFGFVIVHLLGNLQIFLGAQALNAYAAALRKAPALLWATRLILLASVVLHVVATVQLAIRNRQSRPVPYRDYDPREAGLPSRVMIWGGLFLALYIPYHLLHLTTGSVHPQFSPTDIYANMITGFSVWHVSAFYIVAMVALGLHLYHGVFSVFQTLGLTHPRYNPWRKRLAIGSAYLIAGGYITIPLAVLLGVLR